MKTPAMNEIDPHCAGELEPSAAEALALENMMAAEAVLNELASVFFASGSAFASSPSKRRAPLRSVAFTSAALGFSCLRSLR